jgi:hypothetical protein
MIRGSAEFAQTRYRIWQALHDVPAAPVEQQLAKTKPPVMH